MTRFVGVGLLSAGLLLVLARPAGATTITPGSVTFFNFDFTGQVPPPPYANIPAVIINFANVDPGETGALNFHDGLNGNGATIGLAFAGQVPGGFIFVNQNAPGLLDGVFSLKVLGTNGTYDILEVFGRAESATGASVLLTGVPVVAAVSEPATIVLLATGLAGALARRRHHHERAVESGDDRQGLALADMDPIGAPVRYGLISAGAHKYWREAPRRQRSVFRRPGDFRFGEGGSTLTCQMWRHFGHWQYVPVRVWTVGRTSVAPQFGHV